MFEKIIKWMDTRWEEILMTQDIDCYIRVKARLLEEGIMHRTKVYNRNQHSGHTTTIKLPHTYSISVKKDELHRVSEIAFHYNFIPKSKEIKKD